MPVPHPSDDSLAGKPADLREAAEPAALENVGTGRQPPGGFTDLADSPLGGSRHDRVSAQNVDGLFSVIVKTTLSAGMNRSGAES